jgi:hypothetical protein
MTATKRPRSDRLKHLATTSAPIERLVEEAVGRLDAAQLRRRGVREAVLTEVLAHPAVRGPLAELASLFPESRPDEAIRSVIDGTVAQALRGARARTPRTTPDGKPLLTRVK